ncbi:hypothetical protein [Streptomyces sp. NPDC060194]
MPPSPSWATTGIDYLYGAVGTGGSLCGTERVLRERIPDLKIISSNTS